jgi:hypothetical protein
MLYTLPHFTKLSCPSFQQVSKDGYLVPHIRRIFESLNVRPNVCFDISRGGRASYIASTPQPSQYYYE